MKKIITLIAVIAMLTGIFAVPSLSAGEPLTYNELDSMIKTADFVCDMYYAENFSRYSDFIVKILKDIYPELCQFDEDEYSYEICVSKSQLWEGLKVKWPGVSELAIEKMYIPNLTEKSEGQYIFYYGAKGGEIFTSCKECEKGEFIGYTCESDGTYNIYFNVPLPDENLYDVFDIFEGNCPDVEFANLVEELNYPKIVDYKGTLYIGSNDYYCTVKYENRVFKFKLTDGQADYISDEWNPEVPAVLNPMPDKTDVGDINGDGAIDNKDVVVLFRYVSGGNKVTDESIYDINGDGEVDNKDVVTLFRYISAL